MINLLIAGDYCPQERIADMIERKDYSFFSEVCQFTANADYSIVNLECPIVEGNGIPIVKCGPNLKCSSGVIDSLKYAGFNGVTLANNHLKDYGEQGVLKTLDMLDNNSIDRVGGGRTLKDSQSPLILDIKSQKIAVINICESEFSIATKYSAGAAPLDLIDVQCTIENCKKISNYIIIIVHGGHEMNQLPSPNMQKYYRWFIDLGVDAVVNHHQHCYSGYEICQNKPIFYGLGNFCFDWATQRNSIWNEGYMVNLRLGEDVEFDIIPYEQCNDFPKVQIKEGASKEAFNHAMAAFCTIVEDPLLVEVNFERYCKQEKNNILGVFSPYTNRYLRGAAKKGFLPFFMSKKKVAAIYDYINCEAHRNTTLSCLKELL